MSTEKGEDQISHPAPKTSGTRKSEPRVPAGGRLDKLAGKLANVYLSMGMLLCRADMYDGMLLMKTATDRAKEVVAVASHHKEMLVWLERFVEGNDYFALAVGHGFMLYAILAHHGRIKGDAMILAANGYAEEQIVPQLSQEDIAAMFSNVAA